MGFLLLQHGLTLTIHLIRRSSPGLLCADEAGMIRALWRRTETLAAAAISLTLVTAVLLLQNHPHSGQAAVAKITLAREYLVKFTTSSASETYLGGIPAAGGALGDVEGQRGPRCPEQDGSVQNLVYISHQGVAERLGCPINHTMACFYWWVSRYGQMCAPCLAVFCEQGRPANSPRGSVSAFVDQILHTQVLTP